MQNQSPAFEIVNKKTRCNNIRGCAAISLNHQTAQVPTVTFTERARMGSRLIRIPVTTGLESGDPDSFCIDGGFATAVAVEMEAVLPTGEPLQIRADHQALITVGCRHNSDRFSNAIGIDAAQHNVH